jgi:hypothetical protein
MTMHVCPKGHQSQAGDYCDECGAPISGQRSTSGTGTVGGTLGSSGAATPAAAAPPGLPCPDCGSPQSGRFCEVCGFDFLMVKLGGTPAAAPAPLVAAAAPAAATPAANASATDA